MHPALEVPEILSLIFKCGITKCDLSNCARVCRLWGLWAVDVLWRTCRVPLQQVLQVLPPAPKMRDKDDSDIHPVFNIGNIDEHTWRRFLALSSKITWIEVDCGLSEASLERIEFAKQTFDGEPFSRLQAVTLETFNGCGHYYASSLAIVTVPSITHVHLCYEEWLTSDGPNLAWVNKTLPAGAPNVTHFGFEGWSGIKLDVSRYSALKCIEVRVDFIRPHFWEGLASCPLLTNVLLRDCDDVAEWRERWRVDYVQFPALSTFKIRGGNARGTLKLMLRSRMPMLECLAWDSQTGSGDRTHEKSYGTSFKNV